MRWFNWTDGIKKRVCGYLLQNYLGHFLKEKLHYDQLSVDLYNGSGKVENVELDVYAINKIIQNLNAPIEILEGSVKSISVSIPWKALFSQSCIVEVRGIRLTVQPKYMADIDLAHMTDSFCNSLRNMTTSMQVAQECLNDPEKQASETQMFEGLEIFAQSIESILRRIKVKFGNIDICFEHLDSLSDVGIGLELKLEHFEYFDEDSDQENKNAACNDDKNAPLVENVAFSRKQFHISGVNLSMYQFLANKSSTSIATSHSLTESVMINPVTIAKVFGELQVKLRVKQNDQLSGPKIDGEFDVGNCAVFLTPKQLGLLLDFIDGFSSPSSQDSNYAVDSFPNSVSPATPNKFFDYKYDVEKTNDMNHFSSEYSSLELAQPGPVNKPKTVQFHPLTYGTTIDDSIDSVEYTSIVQPFRQCQLDDALSPGHDRKQPLGDGNSDANGLGLFRFQVKIVALAVAVLHSDPTGVRNFTNSEHSSLQESDNSLSKDPHSYLLELVAKHFTAVRQAFEKYSLHDLFARRSLFTNAGSGHDHLQLLAGPLHLDCERQSNHDAILASTVLSASLGNAEILECLFDSENATASMCDCIELLVFPQSSSNRPQSLHSSTYQGQSVKLSMKFFDKNDIFHTSISLDLADCKSEVDISIIDRLSDLTYALSPDSKKMSSTNVSSTFPGASANDLKYTTNDLIFQRALDDGGDSKLKRTEIEITSSHLHVDFRFPIPDLRPEMERRPWFKRMLRDEVLQLDGTDLDCRIVVQGSDEVNHWNDEQRSIKCRFRELSARYADGADKKPKLFLKTYQGDVDQSENDLDWPFFQFDFQELKETTDLYSSDDDAVGGGAHPFVPLAGATDMTYSYYEPSIPKLPSPFSQRKVAHNNNEMVLPGDEEEIQNFVEHASSTSRFNIVLKLPVFVVSIPSKSFIESLYNRFNNDLLLWQPVAPQPNVVVAGETSFIPAKLDCQTRFFSAKAYMDEPDRASLMRDSMMTDDSSSSYFSHNTNNSMHKSLEKPKKQSLISLSLNVSQGSLSLCSTVATKKGSESGQVVIQLTNGSLFTVSQYLGNPNLDMTCLQIESCYIYHKIGLFSLPIMEDATNLSSISSELDSIIFPVSDGLLSAFESRNLSQRQRMITAVFRLELEEDRPMKKCLVAALLRGLTYRHQFLPEGESFFEQLIDMFDISDIEVSGYKPPTFLTELHFHLNDCAIDYKPVHLPSRLIATVGSFALSSNVVANSPQSVMEIVMDKVDVYLSDSCASDFVDLRTNFVNVLSVALLELYVKLRSEPRSSGSKVSEHPDLELNVSNSHIEMWTCADSCALLAALVRYIAGDGDTVLSDSSSDGKTKDTLTCNSDHDQVESEDDAPTPPEKDSNDLRASYEHHLEGLIADAAIDLKTEQHSSNIGPPSNSAVTTAGSEDGSSLNDFDIDDEFCVIDDHEVSIDQKNDPKVEYLVVEEDFQVVIIDNHFTPVVARADQLKAPEHFPMPVVRYTVRDLSCSWSIFGGNDFAVKDANGKVVKDKKSYVSTDYSKRSPLHSGKKPGGVNRDGRVLMEIHMTKARFQHECYGADDPYAARTVFTVNNFEVHDRLQSSQINKFLYHYHNEASPKQSHANMLLVKSLLVRSEKRKDPECKLKVSLQPLRLNIDQDALIFLSEFFASLSASVSDDANYPFDDESTYGTAASTFAEPQLEIKNSPGAKVIDVDLSDADQPGVVRPLFFHEFVFSPAVPIRLDYHGKRIHTEQGKIAGLLMGLGQLNWSQLVLKKIVHRHGLLGKDKLITFTLNEWSSDIRNNQLPAILGGVGPMHSFVQFFQGFRDLLWLPVEQYRRDGRIVRGLQRGTSSFGTSTSMAVLEVTNRFVRLIQTTAETACDIVSPADVHKNRQRYLNSWRGLEKQTRRRRQPSDLREGFDNAVSLVQHGMSDALFSIARVAQKEHERKGVTGAVGGVIRHIPLSLVRPVVIASEATSNVLSGMRNQILPDARKEDEDKWRTAQTDAR